MNRSKAVVLIVVLLAVILAVAPAGTAFGAETAEANLIFFHHSVGSNWLASGLVAALNDSGYFVSDTNYGWTGGSGHDYGSSTDTSDWPTWFTDTVMGLAYPWKQLSSGGPNSLGQAAGENTIIMFKSCYPNSNVGYGIDDEKAIYNSLLPYFEDHPDKMFVLVTPPPMQYGIDDPLKTRELCNWLVDRDTGWLKDLTTGNVFAFDLYNVLTHPSALHTSMGGVETHYVYPGANTLYSAYHSSGDDHPNLAGNTKATGQFVPLLNAWYEEFLAASGSAPRRYQQSDTRLTYLGSWSYQSSGAASGGSLNYTNDKGAAVLVSFTGTSVELLGLKGPNYGEILVSLDGGVAESIDMYNATYAHQQSIYKKEGLGDTVHTLVIECSGEKLTGASSGVYISLDALRILGTLDQATTTDRYQQHGAGAAYMGNWSTAYGSWTAYSDGSITRANAPGCSTNVEFTGTYLAWIAPTGPGYGKALVSLDGAAPVTVDLYNSYNRYKRTVYDTGLLESGPHNLSIYWSGGKRSSSTGTTIVVDAFDLLGTPEAADAALPIEWRYQQSDSRITYPSSWTYAPTWRASGGSFYSTSSAGAAALVNFTGTSVKLVARTAPWYGFAEVCVDGDTEVVDFYSSDIAYKQVVFEDTTLSPGEHTLTIKCLGDKRTESSGYAVSIDALDIVGYLDLGPAVTRVQENDAAWLAAGDIATEGTWVSHTGSWALYSGAGLVTTDSAGAKMTVSFDGRYLAWVAKTTPWYGRAKVTLDGDTANAVTVDLYSPRQAYKRTVYRTGLLSEGPHTVVIEYLGTKYWRSWGTTISVDAFDVVLSPAP